MASHISTNDDAQVTRVSTYDTDAEPSLREPDLPTQHELTTPLPVVQLSLATFVQFAEPVTATIIFPFIVQFIRETGITGGDERKTGYYAGLVESMFYVTECLTAYAWGLLADRIGRKPVLLFGQFVLALSTITFGLSTSYWPILVSRGIQGACNGNIGVSKSIVAEITDNTNIAKAFALQPVMWGFGVTLGPAIGGFLSRPADRWPDTIGKIQIFRERPYFLPCLTAAVFPMLAFILAYFFLEETLPSIVAEKKRQRKLNRAIYDTDAEDPLLSRDNHANYGTEAWEHEATGPEEVAPVSLKEILKGKLLVTLINYSLLSFVDQCTTVLIPLLYSTSIALGGLGLNPFKIGFILAIFGFTNGVFQIVAFPPIHKIFGSLRLFQYGFVCNAVIFMCYGIESLLVKRSGGINAAVWSAVAVQFIANGIMYMAYSSVFILIIDYTPRHALGSVNGIAQMLATVSRTIAPSFASSLFAISLKQEILNGMMVYIVLILITAGGAFYSTKLPQ